jgi:N-glycosylase/DNA lyase
MEQKMIQRIALFGAIDIKSSIESGQPLTFYSEYSNDGKIETLRYPTQKGIISISRNLSSTDSIDFSFFGNYSESTARAEIIKRLALDHDVEGIYAAISTDKFMKAAVSGFYGMRVTSNETWEATLCFIISQFNNIKRIRGIIKKLVLRFGEPIIVNGKEERLFPSPEAISKASIDQLLACGTGFRAKYIKSAAKVFSTDKRYSKLSEMDYDSAKELLLQIDGVGDKVADCVLLFGCNKLESFPIDLWIKRVVETVYMNGRIKPIKTIHAFAEKKWGVNAGYAQQYLFWHGRQNKIGVKNDKRCRQN